MAARFNVTITGFNVALVREKKESYYVTSNNAIAHVTKEAGFYYLMVV